MKINWRFTPLIKGFLCLAIAAIIILSTILFEYKKTGNPGGHAGHDQNIFTPGKNAIQGKWTCSMHPQIQMNKPGQCPICGMNLIPLEMDEAEEAVSESEGNENQNPSLRLSEAAIKLAEIQTISATRSFAQKELRLTGKIDFDETRFINITARFPGRIDKLFVDSSGIPVKKGQHLASIYSPELLAAQQELIESVIAEKALVNTKLDSLKATGQATIDAVREKLRLWGLSKWQISNIEKKGKTVDHMTIYSPGTGVVIDRKISEGEYVKTGDRLFTISNLNYTWAVFDAYESDLPWIQEGQAVTFETDAFPGKPIAGRVSLIHPVLDEVTRTVKVRVSMIDSKGRNLNNLSILKPGMFVHAKIFATIDAMGNLKENSLDGMWTCSMHPEIVSKGPGACPICKMSLVSAEDHYAKHMKSNDMLPPLLIPISSVLLTGKRAVVYVEVGATVSGGKKYEGREVTLGPRTQEHYIVYSGIEEGEEVVANGSFKIDSALQIQAKKSMMNPESRGKGMSGHSHYGGAAEKKSKGDRDWENL